MSHIFLIDHLGRAGDGVCLKGDQKHFIPFALPGESGSFNESSFWVVDGDASSHRIDPFCPYFKRCGGCVAQHMDEGLYRNWKTEGVRRALEQAKLPPDIHDFIDAHGAGRRRVTLHARWHEGVYHVGFMRAKSHDLVEIDTCPVLVPALVHAPQIARDLCKAMVNCRKPLDIMMTATQGGLDVDIRGMGDISDRVRQNLIFQTQQLDLARLSIHGELILEQRSPFIQIGSHKVTPPASGFMQATDTGERALLELVEQACSKVKSVVDLFAGFGPFTLHLAQNRHVHAVESFQPAVQALDKALRQAKGLKPVTYELRDLMRRPLLEPELNKFDVVLLDPPRAGAEAQVQRLAKSKVPLVISVSCDAGTFARDTAILVSGGYHLERVTLVDQFKYSAHIEIVGILKKIKV